MARRLRRRVTVSTPIVVRFLDQEKESFEWAAVGYTPDYVFVADSVGFEVRCRDLKARRTFDLSDSSAVLQRPPVHVAPARRFVEHLQLLDHVW